MHILKLKTFLFTCLGIFLYISHIMLYREITANCAYPFFSALLFLMFSSLWIGIGLLLSPFKKHDKPYFLFTLLCAAPATLLSLIIIQLLCASCPADNFARLALVAFAGCFPQGIISGIILASTWHSISDDSQRQLTLFTSIGYFIAGTVLYPLDLFNVLSNPLIYILSINSLILLVAAAAFQIPKAYTIRYWFLTFATVIIAGNFLLLNLHKYSLKNFFATRFRDWQLVKPYPTRHGRITLFTQTPKNSSTPRFMLVENTKILQILPDDSKLYKTTAIPFSLLPNRKDLRVLAIGSPFSYVPNILSSLPYVEHVSHVTGERILPVTIVNSFSPPQSPEITVFNIGAKKYLKTDKDKFDLIIWLSPKRDYLNFAKMIRLSAAKLTPNGIMAIPASLLAANNTKNTWKGLFKNKISIPGKYLVYAFSNAELSSDLKVLEKRLDKLDDREQKIFPPGTFSIIYSLPAKTQTVNISPNWKQTENSVLKSFCLLNFDSRTMIIILLWAGLYIFGRFLLLRRKALHAAAGFFENGLALMLLMMTLMSIFARSEGDFYYNFGIILGAASAVPMGLFLNKFKIQRLAVIMSIVVVLLCNLDFQDFNQFLTPALAYLNFLCGGVFIADVFKKHHNLNIKLLSIHFLGSVFASVLMFTILISHYSFSTSLMLVILFRIPLIFSRTTLGKIDNPGGKPC